MSFYDNKFLRYFKGHTKQVVGLEMSPQDDTFLSSALDDTVRLWDLRTPNCQACLFSVIYVLKKLTLRIKGPHDNVAG